jgi:hypothetical protein
MHTGTPIVVLIANESLITLDLSWLRVGRGGRGGHKMPLIPLSFLEGYVRGHSQVVLFSVVMAGLAVFSAVSFLFMLALQGNQPYLSSAPTGRCDSLFDAMEHVSSSDPGAIVGFRYDAGHSAVLACTNKTQEWYTGHLAGHAVPFDPWQYQAQAWDPGCNNTDFSQDQRINESTPITGSPRAVMYANSSDSPLDILPLPNGKWWVYTLVFNASFASPGCGAEGQGITLDYNDLPTCTNTNVWAFEHNESELMLYYQIILVAIFVPHIYYLYACIRFWNNVNDNHILAAKYFEEAQKGLPALLFVARAIIKLIRGTTEGFYKFIDTYVVEDKLPPVGRRIFALDSFAYLSEVSFGAVALFGCQPTELRKQAILLLLINLVKSCILFINGVHSWWTRRKSVKSPAQSSEIEVGLIDERQGSYEMSASTPNYNGPTSPISAV